MDLWETITLNGTHAEKLHPGDLIPWCLKKGDVLKGRDWMFTVTQPGYYRYQLGEHKIVRIGA